MARDKIAFILGVHCHQPVGNFGWVIEEAFEKSYRPFMEALVDFPSIKTVAHFSGPLLEWIEINRPTFFETIRMLVERRQVEIIGGGFYEPILMTIPEVDRLEQIEMMNVYAEEHLGMRPQGVWLTERIWEPALPRTLKAAGAVYSLTDDSHFVQAGLDPEKVRGYYYTEDQGDRTAIFPIDHHLRYAVPFKDPEATIAYLRQRYDAGDRSCCTLVDDGEKFGIWPGTFRLLYEEKWLERFFQAIQDASDWLEMTLPTDYMAACQPEGLAYLPTASYFEMGQWTLSPAGNRTLEDLKYRLEGELGDRTDAFLRGGFFRNFFMRYPETNHMHKRMQEISLKIHLSGLEGRPRDEAKRELFMAQCNCGYWHGIFGGLYLPHLREAIYEHLIKAERFVEDDPPKVELYDLDFDGWEEAHLRTTSLAAYLAPHDGGTVIELDHIESATNVVNTLARRHEVYHDPAEDHGNDEGNSIHDQVKVLSEENRKLLVYDPVRRTCFRDVLLNQSTLPTPADIQGNLLIETGGLSTLSYASEPEEPQANAAALRLWATTSLPDGHKLEVVKHVQLLSESETLQTTYTFDLREGGSFEGLLGVQFNLTAPSALGIESPFSINDQVLAGHGLIEPGEAESVDRFSLRDPHRQLTMTLESDRKFSAIWHPVQTVSQSESGFDTNYQASAIWLFIPLALSKGTQEALTISLGLKNDRETE